MARPAIPTPDHRKSEIRATHLSANEEARPPVDFSTLRCTVKEKSMASNRKEILMRKAPLPYILIGSDENRKKPDTSITARLPIFHGWTSAASSETESP